MRKGVIVAAFLLLPAFAQAEELLPAICQQVLAPKPETSLTEIIRDHVVEKLKTVPQALAQEAKEFADEAADTLAGSIEKHKPSLASGVLGASDVYDPTLWETVYEKFLSALAFIIRHWVWALGALTILIIGYSFRP
jgi:hypothetical protein